MNAEVKRRWLDALRSGEYTQGKGCLFSGTSYCCLGVLTDLFIGQQGDKWEVQALDTGRLPPYDKDNLYSYHNEYSILPLTVIEWAGLERQNPTMPSVGENLAALNDNGFTFEQIAALIEENL